MNNQSNGDKNKAGRYYVTEILKSNGAKANDTLSGYSFTTNILTMNSIELEKAINLVGNERFIVEAFKNKNEGASKQIHREINRHVHNYLCAISTYADHTRNFMKKNYSDTKFAKAYEAEVQRTFNSDELCRFVRDLRNYMTHRGLPESSLSLTAKPTGEPRTPSGIPVNLSAGVYYSKGRFLEWDGWTSPSKRYLDKADDKIALNEIFLPHIEKMKAFDQWFDRAFRDHHATDFEELRAMYETYEILKSAEESETRSE